MTLDSLDHRLSTAVEKLSFLQRRVDGYAPEPPKILRQTLAELATTIEALRIAQQQLSETRGVLAATRAELQQANAKYWELFDSAWDACVVTGPHTQILEANKASTTLFNLSPRFLVGKVLSLFICDDRDQFLAQSARLVHTGGTADWMMRLRPRDRAPIEVAARVVTQGPVSERTLRWMMRPAPPG